MMYMSVVIMDLFLMLLLSFFQTIHTFYYILCLLVDLFDAKLWIFNLMTKYSMEEIRDITHASLVFPFGLVSKHSEIFFSNSEGNAFLENL